MWGATGSSRLPSTIDLFQSTRPVWGATHCPADTKQTEWYFNPRAPCGARHPKTLYSLPPFDISIHAPRVGRDSTSYLYYTILYGFQSTRPVWGATMVKALEADDKEYFNPRAPCGARQAPLIAACLSVIISIHAPRVGRDSVWSCRSSKTKSFQSTRPVWGAT